ncbi:MAG TPA: hypothetical protein VIS95_08025 [Solirubrobacterales bacterium]
MLVAPEGVEAEEAEHGQGDDRGGLPGPRPDQRKDDRGQADRQGRKPRQVDAAAGSGIGRLGRRQGDDRDPERGDRQVDPEDQPPVEVDQGAAGERSYSQRQRGYPRPDAQRPGLLLGGESVADDRQRERCERHVG